jgi:hypothetical protein
VPHPSRRQALEELLDPSVDVVANHKDRVEGLTSRIVDLPVLVALARVNRTSACSSALGTANMLTCFNLLS